MKFFQKRSVAVVLTLLIILASIGLGQVRRPVQSSPAPEPADPSALDTSLNTSGYTDWLWDEAGVLSDATEETLCLYNANWDARYGMIMAVAAVSDTDGMAIDTYTYQLGNDIGLGSQDLLLVMDVGGQDAFLIPGDSVTSDSAVLSVFSLPQTGDETQPALWMLLAVASAALIALLCFRRRKDD